MRNVMPETPDGRAPGLLPGMGQRVAVVDVGSNSVRLVVYDMPARLPVPVFNEKADCGLVRGMDKSGKLNPDGVELAHAAMARFVHLSRSMGVERLDVVATAAVREAADGLEFVRTVEQALNVSVQVPSGAEEARLSAISLLNAVPDADGLLGDLGGGSLDLVTLDKGKYGANTTVPLGHLRLMDGSGGDLKKAAKTVDKHLGKLDWLKKIKGRTLYAVGGSWRSIARVSIEQTGYPLHIIDGFELSGAEARSLAKVLSGLSKESLFKMATVSRRRSETLAFASLSMARLMDTAKPARVVFSGFGMREGQLIKGLPPAVRAQDPLIAGCTSLAERMGRFSVQAEEIRDWTAPLFAKEDARHARLRHAASLLSDIGWSEHPDYRAEHIFHRVLRLPFAGLSHVDRAYLALTVFIRYNGDPEASFAAPVLGLLPEGDRSDAETLGLALRLALTISGSAPGLLSQTSLELKGDTLRLVLPNKGREVFVSDAVERRLKTLGRAVDAAGEVV